MELINTLAEAARTAVGFFWKAGWAFVLGYAISGMIQAFVPKAMGNIPLATVLNSNGVAFAGIMGFIYSDLMVPPLVAINAKYYGWRVALYIAAVMFASIVVTAVTLHLCFAALGITPGSHRAVEEVSRFAIDYTFWLNLAMVGVAALMIRLHRAHVREHLDGGMDEEGSGRLTVKGVAVYSMILLVAGGVVAWGVTSF